MSQSDVEPAWQETWSNVKNGGTIAIPEGTFHLTQTLILEGKKDIFIKGAGMGKTVLSFAGQVDSVEGIRILNCENIRLDGFTVTETRGDGLSARDVQNIQFLFVQAHWTSSENGRGSTGINAHHCERTLFYESVITGAPKAGLSVSQCEQVVIRKCRVENSGIGILSVNTSYEDIVENMVSGNSTGILLHDQPDTKAERSWDVEVYKNKISGNNRDGISPDQRLPYVPGTGLLILAASDISVFENTVSHNHTGNILILSYPVIGSELATSQKISYPQRITIRENVFIEEKSKPITSTAFGHLIKKKFGKSVPNIIYDGIQDEISISPTTGRLLPEHFICIYKNTGETFANLDAGHYYKGLSDDLSLFRCR